MNGTLSKCVEFWAARARVSKTLTCLGWTLRWTDVGLEYERGQTPQLKGIGLSEGSVMVNSAAVKREYSKAKEDEYLLEVESEMFMKDNAVVMAVGTAHLARPWLEILGVTLVAPPLS